MLTNQLILYSVPHKSKFIYEQVWREYIIVSRCWDWQSTPDLTTSTAT